MKSLVSKLNHPSKRALEGAAALCVSKTHYNVEIEHFIYKLLEQAETDVRQILRHYDVDIDLVKRHLLGAIDKFKTGCTGTPVLSPNILMLLEQAWSIASLRINQPSIRTAALMMALIDVDQIRGIILESCPLILRIPRHTLRQDLESLIKASPENRYLSTANINTANPESVGLETPVKIEGEALRRFTTNLNDLVVAGKLDPVCGREKEISQLVDILSRRRQNNPILVGEAGVGKTAIIEGLAQRIVAGFVPASLEGAQICTLDLGLLQAGAGMKGEFEERLNQVITDIKSSPLPIILFIDEAHTLIGAGGTAGTGDAANLLKPALARGELRVIAATTWSEYKRHIEGDAALTRRFETVKVAEPSPETSAMILRYLTPSLEKHHKVEILNEAIEAAVLLSQRFLPHRRFPDKAINLLDTTCARVAVSRKGKPSDMEALENRQSLLMVELEMLRRETGGKSNQHRQTYLEQELEQLGATIQSLDEKWQQARALLDKVDSLRSQPLLPAVTDQSAVEMELQALQSQIKEVFSGLDASYQVDRRAIAQVLSSWTGVPVSTMLSYQDGLRHEDIFNQLKQRVVGQDHGLHRIAQNIISYSAGMADPQKPMGVFLLAGPSGVGKTETAQALADILTGSVDSLIRINLSEFQEAHLAATLRGAPPGYVGYGRGGILTEAVRRNPYSVILLDEIEKAHPDVMNIFYQVFDKGLMEDGEGVEVSFRNCLIILTSNVGAEVISDFWERNEGRVDQEFFSTVEPKLWLALNKRFANAFLSRTTVIPYVPLGFGELANITRLKLREIDARLKQQHQADLIVIDSDIQRIIEISQGLQQGARAIDKVLSSQILPKLSEKLLQGQPLKQMRLADVAGSL